MTAPTAPYKADTPALLPFTLGQYVAIDARTATGTPITTLLLEQGTLSWDSTRAPRCILTASARVPEDQATLDALDPRTGVRLHVTAGYLRPDGPDVAEVANLGLRLRPVDRPSNLMALSAAGDEALVTDNAPDVAITAAGATAGAQALDLLTDALGYAPTVAENTVTATATAPVLDPEAGEYWQAIDNLLDTVNADAWDDGLRSWHLTPRPVLGAPVHALAVGVGGTVESSSTALGRAGWANAVQLTYRWTTNNAGTVTTHALVGHAAVTSGPYAPATAGRVVYREVREMPSTQADADAAAASVLARRLAAGRSVTLTAIAAWWLRPGHTVDVTLPTGPTLPYLLTAVSFNLATGSMTLTAVRPDTTTTITPGE